MILPPIEPVYLLAVGIGLIAAEILTSSFVLFWFGIGFLVATGMTYAYNFEEGMVQLAWAFSIGAILMYLLRSKFVKIVMASREKHTDSFEGEGEGIIQNGKVFFRGTYWEAEIGNMKDGDKVHVDRIEHGKLIIR